jgi:hypothetical protein
MACARRDKLDAMCVQGHRQQQQQQRKRQRRAWSKPQSPAHRSAAVRPTTSLPKCVPTAALPSARRVLAVGFLAFAPISQLRAVCCSVRGRRGAQGQ